MKLLQRRIQLKELSSLWTGGQELFDGSAKGLSADGNALSMVSMTGHEGVKGPTYACQGRLASSQGCVLAVPAAGTQD